MRAMMPMVLLALGVTGCMTNAKSMSGKALSFDCSGAGHGWDECSSKADTACGASHYTVVARDEKSGTAASGGSEMKRTLRVECQ